MNWRVLLAFLIVGACGTQLQFSKPRKVLCPHWIPSAPYRLAFSFVLAEDVLHERYARGDDNYYRERNARSLALLPQGPGQPVVPKQFLAIDDLAVGYDRLHQSAAGIPWLRAKLKSQEQAKLTLNEQYTTFANLGTLLIHQNLPGLFGGKPESEDAVREGLKYIELSIKANPNAHFGREVWQAEAVRTILKIHDDPKLRTRIDILGNPWVEGKPQVQAACTNAVKWVGLAGPVLDKRENELGDAARQEARELIPKVGKVPFDEPALGLLGMWWYGGGPNPHLALALAGILDRIGELPLAWVAYQRGLELEQKFWSDPESKTLFRQHCLDRQAAIETVLSRGHAELLAKYQERLKAGLDYQRLHRNPELPDVEARTPVDSDYIFARQEMDWVWKFLGFGLLGAGLYRRFGR